MSTFPIGVVRRTQAQIIRDRKAQAACLAKGKRTNDQVAELLSQDFTLHQIAYHLDMSYRGVKLAFRRIRLELEAVKPGFTL